MLSRFQQPMKKFATSIMKPTGQLRQLGILPGWFQSRKNTANKTKANTNKTRKISNLIIAKKSAISLQNLIKQHKQLSSKKTVKSLSEHDFDVPSGKATISQARYVQIQASTAMFIPLQLMVVRKGYDPIEFLAGHELLKDPGNLQYLLAKEILFKTSTGGLWKKLTENFNIIPDNIRRIINKDKPTENVVITNIDHIVPRAEVAMKFVITIVSSIEFNFEEVEKMETKEFDEYVKKVVQKEIPNLRDIEKIDTAYGTQQNLRLISEINNDRYKDITSHIVDSTTFLPENYYERSRKMKQLPTEIIGYKNKVSDNSTHKVQDILNYMLNTNERITDDLANDNSVFVKKFAANMKRYFRERVGMPVEQKGGSLQTMDEYALFNYLVNAFYSAEKAETPKEKNYEEIQKDLREISINVFKHILSQNILINAMKG